MKRSEKAVPKSLQAVPPNQVLLPGFKAVDINAEILEDNEIAISRDLLIADELFTNNVDLTNLRLVDQDAVILEDNEIAISKDLLVTDELFTNNIDLTICVLLIKMLSS